MDTEVLVGRTLGGYQMRDVIGQGSMGVVYAARDLVLSQDVAVKVIRPDAAFGADAIERLQQEALWLLQCDDPHVVRVYGSGRADGLDYIAMELMAATLQTTIASGRPDLRELVEVGAGILLGLAAAHRVGIIHQDVKPANVGIAWDGSVKLLDFGVASALPWSAHLQDASTLVWRLSCVGSLHYMPPEQLRGDVIDERADVYSAGAVLYELATGLRPFPESRPACLIDAVLNHHPCAPSLLNPELPAAVDEVLVRALAKMPSDRFPSVLAMMDALLQLDASPSTESVEQAAAVWHRGAAPETHQAARSWDSQGRSGVIIGGVSIEGQSFHLPRARADSYPRAGTQSPPPSC